MKADCQNQEQYSCDKGGGNTEALRHVPHQNLAHGACLTTFVTNFGPELPLLFKLHKFGQLILRKITEIVAIRCQILWLKCNNLISAGAPPQSPLGELTALPSPLAGFKGPTLKGRERREE